MKRNLDKLKHAHFDLLIVGGGITGMTIAWDASLRGYSVALIEKKDFGHATSMATSKLIHGGLRYLKNLDFNLVRESLRERRYFSNIIPHQVCPLPFLLPIYGQNIILKYFLKIGLSLYDILSFDKNLVKNKSKKMKNHKWLSRKKALKYEPRLAKKGLRGAFLYHDLQNIHPERINIDFINSARMCGAIIVNYLEVTNILYREREDGKNICGVKVKDQMKNGSEFIIASKVVINCSGPWLNQLLHKKKIKNAPKLTLAKGIHLVMPRRQGDQALFLKTNGNQHLLILPWLNYTLLGTTDTKYEGLPDDVKVTSDEAQKFLDLVNKYYPVNYQLNEIIHCYAGLRTLITPQKEDTNGTYKISRKSEMIDHGLENTPGLISVVGGKYTTSRALAERVVNYVQKTYRLGCMICRTKTTSLASANYEMSFDEYHKQIHKNFGIKYSSKLLNHLIEYYGVYSQDILLLIKNDKSLEKQIHPSNIRIFAEIKYAIQKESALTLSDFLYRRCGWGNEGLKDSDIVRSVAKYMGTTLNWSSRQLEKEISQYLESQKL